MFIRKHGLFFRNLTIMRMAPDGGDGTNGGGNASNGGTEPGEGATGTGTGEGNGASNANATSDDPTTTNTFTKEYVDRLIAEKVAAERKKYEKYKDVDVAEYNSLKQEKAAQEEASKTELEKAQDKVKKAEEEKTKALDLANKRLILAEFKVMARDLGIKYVNDAYTLADLSQVEVAEDGTITGLKEVVDTLVKTKPYLLEEAKGGTGEIDDKSKGDKGKGSQGSIGKMLAENKKRLAKQGQESHYFK